MRIRFLVLFCLTFSLPSAAWNVRTDSEGDLVHWERPAVKLVLDSAGVALLGDPNAEAAIREAVANYEDATPYLGVSITVGHAKPIGFVEGAFDNQNSILALEDWPFSEIALAVTLVTLNVRTNEVLDADVAFNVSSHKFRVLCDPANGDREFDDVQNTITHELGHVLGLMHNGQEEDLVMFPSAAPGETLKRTLKTDDREGLLSLYGTAPDPLSCSASPSAAPSLLLPLLLLTLLKRKRLALFALAPAAAFAAEPVPASVTRADVIAVVQVVSRSSMQHPRNPGLIVTELTVTPIECLKGACGELRTVVVPGGRLGELEQIAVHEPVPVEGQQILVTRSAGLARMIWLEPRVQEQLVHTLRASPVNEAPLPHSTTTSP